MQSRSDGARRSAEDLGDLRGLVAEVVAKDEHRALLRQQPSERAIQLVSIGIIGEYLGRLFLEVKGRPIYVVEGVYEEGADGAPEA